MTRSHQVIRGIAVHGLARDGAGDVPSPLSVLREHDGRLRGDNRVIMDQFSAYQRGRGFSRKTIDRRRGTLRSLCRFLDPKPLDRATTIDIEEWLNTFEMARTKHAYRSDVRVFFHWAVTRELLEVNPAALVDPIKVPKSLPRPIGDQVAAAFTVGTRRTRRMVALGLYAGMRNGEIAKLDAGDVALHHDPVLVTVRNGKGGRDRVIPAHPVLVDYLRDIPRSGPVFPNRHGDAITSNSVWRAIHHQFGLVGLDATPHQLRHTFGTEFARMANGDLRTLAAVMGHESMNTTLGYVGWTGESAGIIAAMYNPKAAA